MSDDYCQWIALLTFLRRVIAVLTTSTVIIIVIIIIIIRKELNMWHSINWQSYHHEFGVLLFWDTV